jgi:hypothetical protein
LSTLLSLVVQEAVAVLLVAVAALEDSALVQV